MDPLWHYVIHGAREGRDPHHAIDEKRYRAVAGLGNDGLSALGHWLAIGRQADYALVPEFDARFYLQSNGDVRDSGHDPLEHYCGNGWREGRPTNHRDAAADDRGAVRLRRAVAYSAPVPSLSALCALPAPRTGSALVDVVVPVHGGMDETLTCLRSLLAAPTETAFEIVVVDDATPEPALAEALDTLAAAGCITLLRHEANRGFAAAVNRGSAMHPDRDVVWLNADTEVYPGWLDRLRAAALAEPDIATATPFTTNGTVCSYPRFDRDNPDPLELPWADLDALAARVNAGIRIDLPTAVAFATYVRRDALEVIGPLDAETFGRGYGEETDFCRRGRVQGWRDVLAADVFVHHRGATSFGPEKAGRLRAANAAINHRYSGYHAEVQRFITADPLRAARRALDLGRLRRLARPRGVLLVGHGRGGGTHRNMVEEAVRLTGEGAAVYTLTTNRSGKGLAALGHVAAAELPAFEAIDPVRDTGMTAALLKACGISEIHVHQLIDFAPGAEVAVAQLADCLGARMDVSVHDYFAICPRINLVDATGIYCNEPPPTICNRCLEAGGTVWQADDIGAWRARWEGFLSRARQVRVPSEDARARLQRHMPAIAERLRVVPHEIVDAAPRQPRQPRQPRIPRARLRIGAIGAIGAIKGFEVLIACAKAARRQDMPVDFVVIGYTADDWRARQAGIEVTGAYREADLPALLARADLDLIFLPSVWPETFSYTLSTALHSGLPVAAFDLGAQAERLRTVDRGVLVPLDLAKNPEVLLPALRHAATKGDRPSSAARDDSTLTDILAAVSPRTLPKKLPPMPTTRYAIWFTARSGSSWLTDVLRDRGLGIPNEWLNPNFFPFHAKSLGTTEWPEYFERLQRRHSIRGVFGVELTSFQAKKFFEEVDIFHYMDLIGNVIIHFREDIVLQAISLYKATESGRFHSFQPVAPGRSEQIAYSAAGIEQWLRHLAQQEALMHAFVIPKAKPLFLSYEKMINVGADITAANVGRFIGHDPRPAQYMEKRHQKLAGDQASHFAARFRSENAKLVAAVERKRDWLFEGLSAHPLLTHSPV